MFFEFSILCTMAQSVNHPPVINLNAGAKPVVLNYGESVQLPINIFDRDGDRVTLFYQFDDDTKWQQTPASTNLNIFPGSVFANLDPTVEHTIRLLASDGTLKSEPVSIFWPIMMKTDCDVLSGFFGNPFGGDKKQSASMADQGILIPMELRSFRGNSVSISYSFDDSDIWSDPVAYPLGQFNFPIPQAVIQPYCSSGDHKIAFQFQETGNVITQDVCHYTVNSPPHLHVMSAESLYFKGTPVEPVTLPLSVLDDDNDEVSILYRFDGYGDWIHVPAGLGENVLPADAFANHAKAGTGFVEITAWDGYDHSAHQVKFDYEMDGEGLSPTALIGICVGGMATIALAFAVIVVIRRKKSESTSSTGLISDDEQESVD
jgi:hypothetical protein